LSKNILITGSNGLLGQKLAFLFSQSDYYKILLASKQPKSVFGKSLPYQTVDTGVKQEITRCIREFAPDVIINAAAMTDVDGCEEHREKAYTANVTSVENIVTAAKAGTHIIHFSTDYIFDGKNGPYDESAIPNPLSYYGKTKLASENILRGSNFDYSILRTMVLYGTGMNVKTNFALWVIRSLEENKTIRLVNDQLGNPTLADDLAYATLRVVEIERSGIYHIAGREIVSRFDFARAIAEVFAFDESLISPIATAELKQKAPRPLNSGLLTLKAESELDIKMSGVKKGLTTLYHQFEFEKKFDT